MGFAETRWDTVPSTGAPDPTLADEPIGRQFASVSVINARVCFVDDGLEPERIMQCDALPALPTAALGNRIRAPDVSLRPFLVDHSRRRKGKVNPGLVGLSNNARDAAIWRGCVSSGRSLCRPYSPRLIVQALASCHCVRMRWPCAEFPIGRPQRP